MPIKMDTDAVRSLASSLQNFSASYENRLRAIKQSAESANWQSQAREEFIQDLNLVAKGGTLSVEALRLMSRATNRKVDQWEAIGNVFNGPFYFLEGIWDSFKNYLGNSWNNLLRTMGSIKWPVATAITGITTGLAGVFTGFHLNWDLEEQTWWPFGKDKVKEPQKISIEKNNLPEISQIDNETGSVDRFSGLAEKVKIGTPNKSEFNYTRGNDGSLSNCTWYTAQAVHTASDGKVSVPAWGDANLWRNEAQNYLNENPNGFIEGIDSTPRPGDIMTFGSLQHVSFVEKVEVINGKTLITWVEENYSGKVSWSNAQQIKIDGEPLLRWRITREMDQLFLNKYDPKYIHINY